MGYIVRKFYMRESPGLPSLKAQKAALGLDKIAEDDPVYIDVNPKRRRSTPGEPYPELALVIRSLRSGESDELAVFGPEIFGGSDGQIFDVVQAVGAKGAAIYDATADQLVAWEPKAVALIAWVKAGGTRHREGILRKARIARAQSGKPYGKPAKLTGKALEAARAIWTDPNLTRAQAAEKLGFSPAHGYRIFGATALPIFGRKKDK
jgi:hypothetical protein